MSGELNYGDIKKLIKLCNELDSKGLYKDADAIDRIVAEQISKYSWEWSDVGRKALQYYGAGVGGTLGLIGGPAGSAGGGYAGYQAGGRLADRIFGPSTSGSGTETPTGTTPPAATGTTSPPAAGTTSPPAAGTTSPPAAGTTSPPAAGTTSPPATTRITGPTPEFPIKIGDETGYYYSLSDNRDSFDAISSRGVITRQHKDPEGLRKVIDAAIKQGLIVNDTGLQQAQPARNALVAQRQMAATQRVSTRQQGRTERTDIRQQNRTERANIRQQNRAERARVRQEKREQRKNK